jgi:hypothetical protein
MLLNTQDNVECLYSYIPKQNISRSFSPNKRISEANLSKNVNASRSIGNGKGVEKAIACHFQKSLDVIKE